MEAELLEGGGNTGVGGGGAGLGLSGFISSNITQLNSIKKDVFVDKWA